MHRILLGTVLAALVAAVAFAAADQASAKGVVNVNTATAEELQLLPRIGPAMAERIIAFREANGPFRKVDELVAVKGIGDRSLEQLRPYLVIQGETTLKEKVRLPRQANGEAGS